MADITDLLSGFGTTPPEYLGGLLGQDAVDKLKKQAMGTGIINTALAYLAAPKNQNLGLGRIIGQSLMAGQQGAQGVYTGALGDYETQQKIEAMQRAKKLQEQQDAFRAQIGQPNATRDIVTQPTEQVPVPAAPDATVPNFATQPQAPTVTQEQYYDPQVLMQQALQSGVLPFDKYLELQAKENKPQGKLLTTEEAKANGLPTDQGQKWNKTQNGTFEIVSGTTPSTKSSVSILTNDQAKALNLPTGRGQVYQQDKTTNKIDLIEGTVAPASTDGGGAGGVDFLSKEAQANAAALYLKTGTLPPLGSGKNAALTKANILNMAALMNKGKTPDEAATAVFTNKENRAAELTAVKTFAGGIEGRTKRALNTASDHLFTLEEAGKALNNGDIRLFNSVGNTISKELGVSAPTSFDAVKKIVAGEIVKATTGSAGALGDRKEVEDSIMAANSPQQLLDSIAYYKKLMAGQLGSLELQWETGTNRSKEEFRQGLSKRTLGLLPPIEKAPTASTAKPTVVVPTGVNVDPVTWSHMTEQERALFLPKKK